VSLAVPGRWRKEIKKRQTNNDNPFLPLLIQSLLAIKVVVGRDVRQGGAR
jgi:hypothetical protein